MFLQRYNEWINSKVTSEEIKNELKSINNDKEKEDRFYKQESDFVPLKDPRGF